MALLEMQGITKIYNQGKIEVPALRGVDLIINLCSPLHLK